VTFERDASGPETRTVGVPAPEYLEFFGDTEAEQLYESAVEAIRETFAETVVVDFEAFVEAGELLYDGPWVAERLESIESFVEAHAEEMNPVVREIISEGTDYSAIDTFQAFHELERLKTACTATFEDVDVIVTPTTGTTYTVEEIHERPIERNGNLGYYTDYVNLLDLAAIAVPTDRFNAGPGFGITVLGEAGDDTLVAAVGERIQAATEC